MPGSLPKWRIRRLEGHPLASKVGNSHNHGSERVEHVLQMYKPGGNVGLWAYAAFGREHHDTS